MTLHSMTGYGRGMARKGGLVVVAEFTTVNRKQLDIQLRLPRELQVYEPQVWALIRTSLYRGRVTGEIGLDYSGAGQVPISVDVDEALARASVEALRASSGRLGLEDDLGASTLLNIPRLLRFNERPLDEALVLPVLQEAVARALGRLVAMRKREGKALGQALREERKQLEGGLGRIARRTPVAARAYRKSLLDRIASAELPLEMDDSRLLQEVVQFAERCDITEELARLNSHLEQVQALTRQRGAVGREMEFLCQEVHREINTIGSKANDTVIIREVISFKASLERFREQVRNIE